MGGLSMRVFVAAFMVCSFSVQGAWAREEDHQDILIQDLFPVRVGETRHHGWFLRVKGKTLLAAIDRRTVWKAELSEAAGTYYVLVKVEHITFGKGYLQPGPEAKSSDVIEISLRHQMPRTVSAELYYLDRTRLRTLVTAFLPTEEREEDQLLRLFEVYKGSAELIPDLSLLRVPIRLGESFKNDETVVTISGCGDEPFDNHKVSGWCVKASLAETVSGPVDRYFEEGVGIIKERFREERGPVTIELLDW